MGRAHHILFPLIGKAQTLHLSAPMIRSEEFRALLQQPLPPVPAIPEKLKLETKEENSTSVSNDPAPVVSLPTDDPIAEQALPPTNASSNGQGNDTQGFNWNGALKQSLFLTGIMHGFCFATEPSTHAELRGLFLKDYFRSLSGQWH